MFCLTSVYVGKCNNFSMPRCGSMWSICDLHEVVYFLYIAQMWCEHFLLIHCIPPPPSYTWMSEVWCFVPLCMYSISPFLCFYFIARYHQRHYPILMMSNGICEGQVWRDIFWITYLIYFLYFSIFSGNLWTRKICKYNNSKQYINYYALVHWYTANAEHNLLPFRDQISKISNSRKYLLII